MKNKILLAVLILSLTGCFGAFRPEAVIAHPDSPFLIQEVKGKYARVAVYSKSENKLIDFGWVNMEEKIQGYTLSKYDWDALIAKQEKKNGNNE